MDVDVDFSDRDTALTYFKHTGARNSDGSKHKTGVYFHRVPSDPHDGLCTIDHKQAEEDYFKLDFLNVGFYRGVKSREHLDELMSREPIWELLQEDDFIDNVFQLHGNGDILRVLKPSNIEELAAVLAIIRPSKRYLLNHGWDKIHSEAWTKPMDGSYYFKKSHAVAYAHAVVVHINLLTDEVLSGV